MEIGISLPLRSVNIAILVSKKNAFDIETLLQNHSNSMNSSESGRKGSKRAQN